MKLEFIPKFITLLAGAVVCIITIVKDMDVTYSLELLLATLIIFYIIGLLAKKIIQKVVEGNMFVKRNQTILEDIKLPDAEDASTIDDSKGTAKKEATQKEG